MPGDSKVTFFVPGLPVPGGSKRFVGFGKHTGKAILVDAAGERNKNWRASVAQVAAAAMSGRTVLTGPLSVEFTFLMPRPRGHFGKRGLRPGAPMFPDKRPDCTKLIRAVEDALTSICWADDSQIVEQTARKSYVEGGSAGCHVSIYPVEASELYREVIERRHAGEHTEDDDELFPREALLS